GYEDGTFRPSALITRAELATMLARALGLAHGHSGATTFADDDEIPSWARGAVSVLQENGLLNGRGDNRFAPNEPATRAEAVVLLLSMLALVSDTDLSAHPMPADGDAANRTVRVAGFDPPWIGLGVSNVPLFSYSPYPPGFPSNLPDLPGPPDDIDEMLIWVAQQRVEDL